jgi:hypothetical protein
MKFRSTATEYMNLQRLFHLSKHRTFRCVTIAALLGPWGAGYGFGPGVWVVAQAVHVMLPRQARTAFKGVPGAF